MNRLKVIGSIVLAGICIQVAPAQKLRKGLAAADTLVVARQVGKKQWNEQIVLHRLQVLHTLRAPGGAEPEYVVVVELKNVSHHQKPVPRQSRLYCLHDYSASAQRMSLPADEGPFFKMSGHPGSNPLIGADWQSDPHVELARLLAAAERGTSPAETVSGLYGFALGNSAIVRREATLLLSERPTLRDRLSPLQWSALASRAGAETEDIPYKIALAELCASGGVEGLVEALCLSLGPVKDPDYARTVGRIATLLHGERALEPFRTNLQHAHDPEVRRMTLLAVGATRTNAALDALLKMRRVDSKDAFVDAALREHGSAKAKEALLRGKK